MTKYADDRQSSEQTDPALPQNQSVSTSSTALSASAHLAQNASASVQEFPADRPREHGGQAGLEPTRYGDWEKKGRCTDF